MSKFSVKFSPSSCGLDLSVAREESLASEPELLKQNPHKDANEPFPTLEPGVKTLQRLLTLTGPLKHSIH